MRRNKSNKVVADINITPFTDVVLVLLIIFMITTPMLSQHEIKVNLPKAEKTETDESKNIEVSIDKDGLVYLNGSQIHLTYFEDAVRNVITKNPNKPIVIKGDKTVQYNLIIQVMDKAKKAGATKFALAVEMPENKKI